MNRWITIDLYVLVGLVVAGAALYGGLLQLGVRARLALATEVSVRR